MKPLTTICVVLLAALSLTIAQVEAFDSATDSETEEAEVFQQEALGGSSNPGVSHGSTMDTIVEITPTQSQIDPAAQDPVWVLEEIYIADTSTGCGESPFTTPLPLNTKTLTRECSNEHESGWANMVLTLNFSYPQQISYGNQGTFTANASFELDQFSSKGSWAKLSLELKGELWSYSPKCKKEDETREDFGPGEPVFTILEVDNLSCDFQALCEPNCDYSNDWWSGDEAVFLFDVDSSAGGVSPGFYLWLKYKQAVEDRFALWVRKKGDGSGTVKSNDGGINCGNDCTHSYPDGTSVTLTATPDTGSIFSGWSGDLCSGTGLCTVTMMTSDLQIVATFDDKKPSPSVKNLPSILEMTLLRSPADFCTTTKNDRGWLDCDLHCYWQFVMSLHFNDTTTCSDGSNEGPNLNCDIFRYDNGACLK